MSADVSVKAPAHSERPEPLPPERGEGRWRQRAVTAVFLIPAVVFLAVWILYPTIYTVIRSLFDQEGSGFVGIDNYKELFSSDTLLTAIKNNAIWLAVVPALVTAIGLVFAVLIEKIRWSIAFRIAVFMPMAISLFAAGVIWHIMLEKDPEQGAVNAGLQVVHDTFTSPGPLTRGQPSGNALEGSAAKGIVLKKSVKAGDTALLGLTAIPPA